jgi:hypothetical protein
MKEPHIAPENNRKTHSSEYLMSDSMKPHSASNPNGIIECMNQVLPSIVLAAFRFSSPCRWGWSAR